MKKIWIIIALALLMMTGKAQIPGFSVGPKIGFNTNRLTTDIDSIKINSKGQFQIGAFMRIGKKIYFQPEISYVVKGGKLNIANVGSQEIMLKSITIPLLVGTRPINAGIFNVRFMAGPTMSFITQKTLKSSDRPGTAWPIKSKDDLAKSLWSIQMGGGVDVLFLTLDIRYEIGLNNIYTGTSDLKMHSNLFNISLGYKLL